MKRSIEILLNKLGDKHIARHILCPSVYSVVPNLKNLINNPIEIIDERSAIYVATGMCEEIGAPVVVWCADNDSYRNLTPALTEAYYRKLPILVVALSCDGNINQAINPQDTIRYYVNNSTLGSRGTDADIDLAIKYLYADVKGPVYLSIGKYTEGCTDYRATVDVLSIDVTSIAKILPSDACVHFGSCFSCSCAHLKDVTFRKNHVTNDGNFSMLIGSAIVASKQLHIGIFTADELSYDLNMFGNRHVGNNLVVMCIVQNQHASAIYDFAQRMQWECKKIQVSEIETIKSKLVISEKPQYIEVAL